MLYYIILLPAWLIFHILFRIHTVGRENLDRCAAKGVILAPSHISALDPVFIVLARLWGLKMDIFAKKELFEINPVVSWVLKELGGVCVRGTKEEAAAIENTIERCRSGRTLLIFPEGTREREGKLLPPKSGLFVIAAQAESDVIPMRVLYDTPDGKLKLFCRVRVVFGEPIPASDFAMENRRDMKALRANKQKLVENWRALGKANAFEKALLPE